MSATKNECEIVNRLSRKVEKELSDNMTEVNASLAEINEKLEDVAVIDDTTKTTTTTWSSSKIKTEIDAGGGGGSSFEPAYSMAKQFYALSTSYLEKINTLRDFPDITISPGHMYLVNWGVYKRDAGVGVANMNANFKLEILSNNSVQRTIEVNQPNGSGQQIFGTSIQPFTFLLSKDATNIGFKLYGNNSNGEKSYTFDFVIQIYDLGEVK